LADKITVEQRSRNMQQIHSKNTKPEVMVAHYLFSKGLRYRKNDKRYPGHPDIVLPKYKAVIFVNGCFWHMHEGCSKAVWPKSNVDYWGPKLLHNKEKDHENISALQKMGWRVFVVWECQLDKKQREDTLKCLYEDITGLLESNEE